MSEYRECKVTAERDITSDEAKLLVSAYQNYIGALDRLARAHRSLANARALVAKLESEADDFFMGTCNARIKTNITLG